MQNNSWLDDSFTFQIWQLNNKFQRKVQKTLKPFNLSYIEFILLSDLADDPKWGWPAEKQAVRDRKLNKMRVSRNLKKLQDKELVRCLENDAEIIDCRLVNVKLLPAGFNTLKDAREALEKVDKTGLIRIKFYSE